MVSACALWLSVCVVCAGAAESREDLPAVDPQEVQELLDELSREMVSVERRVADLHDKVLALWEEHAPRGRTAPSMPPPGLEGEDARMHESLVRRQEALLAAWKALEGEPGEAGEARRDAVRNELREVLLGILDLRERGRDAQVQRLRRRLDSLQRELDHRRDERVRREMVEARLQEFLGDGGRDAR